MLKTSPPGKAPPIEHPGTHFRSTDKSFFLYFRNPTEELLAVFLEDPPRVLLLFLASLLSRKVSSDIQGGSLHPYE